MRSGITAAVALLATVGRCSHMSSDTTLLASGVTMENNATHSRMLVQKLYPDQTLSTNAGTTFSLVYGGLYLSGYYSLLGGGTQIQSVIDNCKGLNGVADKLSCANSAAQAAIAHGLVAFVGGTYGDGHIAYIAGVARQATGINAGNNQGVKRLRIRQSCPAEDAFTSNSYWEGGNQGVKVSTENTCINWSNDQYNNAIVIAASLPQMMADNSAWHIQATFWQGDQPNNVLARIAFNLMDQAPDICPELITGSGCHYNP